MLPESLNVGIDIDGVLADLITPTLELINRKIGTNLSQEDIDHWHALPKKANLTVEEVLALMDQAWVEGKVGLLEGSAAESLHRLKAAGAHITVISKRTKQSLPAVSSWLLSQNIPFNHLVFMVEDKWMDSKFDYPIHCLMDDSPKAVEKIRYSFHTLFLRNQPWNSYLTDLPRNVIRVGGIDQMVEYLLKS